MDYESTGSNQLSYRPIYGELLYSY